MSLLRCPRSVRRTYRWLRTHAIPIWNLFCETVRSTSEPPALSQSRSVTKVLCANSLGSAVRRTRETFLIQLERVLAGRQQPTLASAGAYDRNIAAFLATVSNSAAMSDEGHWEMTIQPFPYITRRVPLDGLLKRITNSTVNLRGWPLPDVGTVKRSDDAIGSASDWGQYHERWQFQSSGVFVCAFRLSSDENPEFKGDLLVRDAL